MARAEYLFDFIAGRFYRDESGGNLFRSPCMPAPLPRAQWIYGNDDNRLTIALNWDKRRHSSERERQWRCTV